MKQFSELLRPALAAVVFSVGISCLAQGAQARLTGPIEGGAQTVLAGSRPPLAAQGADIGALPSGTKIQGMTLVFSRSAAQETALQTLLAAQQNPASPKFHQWLTPDTFASQFGLANTDIATVQSWLQAQGFSVDSVARSHDRISFTGTAGQVATTFGAQMHQYKLGSETHFAPASDLSVPAALAPMVSTILHVSDFRPKPMVRFKPGQKATPAYTSSQSQAHFLTPEDVATMYNVSSIYSAGFTGTGQSIAIAGQTTIQNSDISHFQTAAGLPANLPTQVLVPNTGPAGVSYGDEGESDIDVEYSTGMAPAARVFLVATGNSENYSVFDAFTYAITEDIAPIVSISYGNCELALGSTYILAQNAVFEEAVAQGQTLIASAGDSGSTACYGEPYTGAGVAISTAQQEAPAISFPADSPYVTALGGTEMANDDATSSQYWSSASGSDAVSTLLSYVPETVWNEDFVFLGSPEILAGGGGTSTVFARPSYQANVPGIPTGTNRLNPDISLQASTSNPGYLYCTSDLSDLAQQDLTNSCATGFRDSSGTYLTVAGGTSFAAPVFAGLMAVLNQATNSLGQGNVNSILYTLAANSSTYAAAFHDVSNGSNACTLGTSYCSTTGAADYAAGTGFDQATGLGSINFASLVAAWPASAKNSLAATSTTLSAASVTPASAATDTVTITVAPITGAGTPTGTVALYVDSNTTTSATATVTLANGQATYTYPGTTATGSHVILAIYSGDATYASSQGAVSLTVPVGGAPIGSFALSASNVALTSNTAGGSSSVTITSVGGYVGEVNFAITSGLPANVCYTIYPVDVDPQYGPSTNTLSIVAGTSVCGAANSKPGSPGAQTATPAKRASNSPGPQAPMQKRPLAAMLAGLLAIGFASSRRRFRRLPSLLILAGLTLTLGLGLSGCGGNNGSGVTTPVVPPTPPSPTGTAYTLTLAGTDSVNPSLTSSTTFTLTIAQ